MIRLSPDDLRVSSFAASAETADGAGTAWPTDTEQIECWSPWCPPTAARTCECPPTEVRCGTDPVAEPAIEG